MFSSQICALLFLGSLAAPLPGGQPVPAPSVAAVQAGQDGVSDRQTAVSWIEAAFSADVSALTPEITTHGGKTFVRFYPDPSQPQDNYLVQLDAGRPYPVMLYHFQRPNTQHQNLAADPTLVYDPQWVSAAQDYVQALYGVSCEEAAVQVYVYQHKIAVQFQMDEAAYFDVRFYAGETEPAGCLYLTSPEEAAAWLTSYDGKILYDSTETAAHAAVQAERNAADGETVIDSFLVVTGRAEDAQ